MTQIVKGLELGEIIYLTSVVGKAFDAALTIFGTTIFGTEKDWPPKTGAYFAYANERGSPRFVTPIREVPEEKAGKYSTLCLKKAIRLGNHPEHKSSWESQDPDRDKYPGAIRVEDSIFSMSGLPSLGDEAVMLAAAGIYHRWRPTVMSALHEIALRSKNPYWQDFLFHLTNDGAARI